MRRLLGTVAAVAVLLAIDLVALPPAGAALSARTWTVRALRIPAGEQMSIGLHPDVARAELTGAGGPYEVCQAVMDGTAGGEPGQSWPSVTGFDACIRSDGAGRVVLPSIVVPTFHVAFLVRGIDGGSVRLRSFRLRYVPADGFFAFAVPMASTTFSVVPDEGRTIGVAPVARAATTVPAGVVVRVDQRGRRVPRVEPDPAGDADEQTFGPLRSGRPVTVTVKIPGPQPDATGLAYVVRWS